ncbi:MAG: aminotransferase class V-fold PLP-dependent enzyme [Gammaproteobacteria bacterium]|nr:aminotransferase class V-fold PLP-dependent enzyme [Gammaproteobacteria bacterium]MDH4254881.1 aminotransferase class V-fold PLP-dependent enzyme [Gammaproteobacteria bacterium]MDH5310604.1 aminotransferase class V-fold PLP-dependent enzyme [Gammaproteobacteria bacterium]
MKMERRAFLKTLGGASLAGTLGGYSAAIAQVTGAGPAAAFPFADDKVPMNAANLCPMPSAISSAVARYAGELDVDMSDPNRRRIEAFKNDARAGIARQLGVKAEEIAVVRNTSEANNIFVQGMSLDAGDEVLLWDQNHPSNSVAWEVRASRTGCTVRYFSIPLDTASIDEVVDLVAGSIGERTRVLSFTHISNVTGFRLPAAEICAAARRKAAGLHIHVDGAQTWGAVDVNLADIGCDSFSGSAHKWYMGPREVGMLFVREAAQPNIWPGVVSVPWGDTAEPAVPGARKFEALGQRDDAAIAALAETVSFHDGITPAGIERRSREIADLLREGLLEADVPFVSSVNPNFTSSVIILSAPQENRRALLENVLRDGGVILAGVNGLRLSPHYYNTPGHVERAVAAVAKSRDLLG